MDGGFYRRDEALNVLGEPLISCSEVEPVTGYYRIFEPRLSLKSR